MIHVTFLLIMAIHPAKIAQIALLVYKEVRILSEYSDFSDVCLEKKALVLLEATDLNKHAIGLQKSQQLLYRLIYSLSLVELKTLKTYIETNLANSFICSSKSLAGTYIFFIRKPNINFYLCMDYRNFNQFIIRNQYLLLFISKSLDRLSQIKRFI